MIHNIFDPTFNSAPRVDMYRSWVISEAAPGEPQALLENWSAEEREAFCGVYEG